MPLVILDLPIHTSCNALNNIVSFLTTEDIAEINRRNGEFMEFFAKGDCEGLWNSLYKKGAHFMAPGADTATGQGKHRSTFHIILSNMGDELWNPVLVQVILADKCIK